MSNPHWDAVQRAKATFDAMEAEGRIAKMTPEEIWKTAYINGVLSMDEKLNADIAASLASMRAGEPTISREELMRKYEPEANA